MALVAQCATGDPTDDVALADRSYTFQSDWELWRELAELDKRDKTENR